MSRVLRCPLLALVCSCVTVAGSVYRLSGQTCARQPERTFPVGSVTEVNDREPPCGIEFHDTGIRLESVADGSRPDPGQTVLVDSNGRFITANAPGWSAAISVWDARGRYLSSFGREGEGPGEFSGRGMMSLFIDGRDNLHVRHGFSGWSVFSPRHEFIRSLPRHKVGGGDWTTVLLDDGSVLDSEGRDGHLFRMADSTGSVARTFGTVGDGSSGRGARRISHAGGDTFWAGPGEEGADAYLLEEWGIDGTLRRKLRRDISWYRWRGERDLSPQVVQLHIARGGLLYVLIFRPTEEYINEYEKARQRHRHGIGVEPADLEEEEERLNALIEFVIEVIDTKSGELLASDVYRSSEGREIIPWGLFRGSLRGYRYKEGESGMPFVEIVTVELVAR